MQETSELNQRVESLRQHQEHIFKIVLFLSQGNDDSMQLEIQLGDRPPNFCRESYQRRYSSLVGPARIKKIMS